MNPDPEQNDGRELLSLANSIETYRADRIMSKALLLRSYPELGTDKTYGKIVKGELTELDITNRWLPAYRQVWAQIQTSDTDVADDSLIEDLTGPVEICRSYLETRNEKTNARFIALIGDSGLGKTSAIEVMKSKPYGVNILVVEAIDVWKNQGKGTAIPLLRAIGKKLGVTKQPGSARDGFFDEIVAKLNAQRRCIVIEEAHHLCPAGLNTIKALINLTSVLVVVTAMPILWQRLESSREAYAECKQLTGNRLAERIVLTLRESDVKRILEKRLGLASGDTLIVRVVRPLMEMAAQYSNLKFVARAVKRYLEEVRQGENPTVETFLNAMKLERKRRIG